MEDSIAQSFLHIWTTWGTFKTSSTYIALETDSIRMGGTYESVENHSGGAFGGHGMDSAFYSKCNDSTSPLQYLLAYS